MKLKSTPIDIAKTEKVCYNCKHMLWMVGIGQGVRCGYEFHKNGSTTKPPPMLPSLMHTCENFEFKESLNEKNTN